LFYRIHLKKQNHLIEPGKSSRQGISAISVDIGRRWSQTTGWLEQHKRSCLLALIVLAGLMFSFYVLRSPTVNKEQRQDDPWTIALNLAQGKGYTACNDSYFPFCARADQQTAMREPVMVLLFAAAAWLLGPSVYAAFFVELLLYLGILFLVYSLTRRIANTPAALLAALFWVLYLPLGRLFENNTGDLSAAFWFTLGMIFFLRALRRPRLRDLLATGVFTGLAALSRSALLAPAGVLFLYLLFGAPSAGRSIPRWNFRPAVLFLVALLLTLSPWLVRNQMVFGRPLMTTLSGYNLFRHSSPIQTSNYLRYVGPDEAEQRVDDLLDTDPSLSGTENEAQIDVIYQRVALQTIAAHPWRYLTLSLYRFFPLWTDIGVLTGWQTHDTLVLFQQIFLLVTALLGAFRLRPRPWPLILCIVILNAAYMAVDAQVRYLTPIMPLVMALSAAGLVNRPLSHTLPALSTR
jgi:4-amino-4-deoxy-L-arabinose transferase-like glycosyltransferase